MTENSVHPCLSEADLRVVDEQLARINKTLAEAAKAQAETHALKTRTFPAWAFILAIIAATLLTFMASGTGPYLVQSYLPPG